MIYFKSLDAVLAFVASIVGRVDIAVALAPSSSSIVVVSPTRRPSPSSCPRAVHRRRAPLSFTVELSSCRSLPSIAVALEVHRRCARAVPRRPSPSRSRRARLFRMAPAAVPRCPSSPSSLIGRRSRPRRRETMGPNPPPPPRPPRALPGGARSTSMEATRTTAEPPPPPDRRRPPSPSLPRSERRSPHPPPPPPPSTPLPP